MPKSKANGSGAKRSKVNRFLCLDFSHEAEKKFKNELYPGEQHTVIWRTEEKALEQFNKYGNNNWKSRRGESGTWLFATLNKAVQLHWRFEGVENGKPIFFIGDISWMSEPCKYRPDRVNHGYKIFQRKIMLVIAVFTLLTLLLEVLGIFGNTIQPIIELVTAFLGSISYFSSS